MDSMAQVAGVEFGPAGLADALLQVAAPFLGPDGKLPLDRVVEFLDVAIPLAGYPRCTAEAGGLKCNKPDGHQRRCRTSYANLGLLVGQIQEAHDRLRAEEAGPGGPPPPPLPRAAQQQQPGLPEGVNHTTVLANILTALQGLEGRLGALEAARPAQAGDGPAGADGRREEMDRMVAAALAGGPMPAPQAQIGVTNATAAGVAGLNAAAARVAAATSTMPLATAVPVPLAGHALAGQAAGGAAAAALAGETGVVVPYAPVLAEHFSEQERWGAFKREAPVQFVTDPFTGLTSLRIAPSGAGAPTAAGGGRAPKSGDALARALPTFPAYCLADQQVELALQASGCTVAGYGVFRQAMLRLAKRADLAAPADWQEFLLLDRNLRLIQHLERLPWDTAGGQIDANEVTMFLSAVAARAATRRPPLRAAQPAGAVKPARTPFRAAGSGPGGPTAGEQPNRAKDCVQFWHGGPTGCKHGADCKFSASHMCRKCGSTAHGTGQHTP